jgi:hypothetical protein
LAGTLSVKVTGLDKAIRDIHRRFDPKEADRKVTEALAAAAKSIAVPAIANEAPDGAKNDSPWRRGLPTKRPGPMRSKVGVKKLRRRTKYEYGAVYVGIRVSYSGAVIRGTKPHFIPYKRGGKVGYMHPGAHPNDIIGRAIDKGTEKALVQAAVQAIMRV